MTPAPLVAAARVRPRVLAAASAGVATLLLLPQFGLSDYELFIARLALFGGTMAATWSLLAGIAGQFSFAHVAIAGIAAYTAAIWCRDIRAVAPALSDPWVSIPVAVLAATVVGTALGMVVLRLRGAYLALFTLAFGEIARLVVIAEKQLTGGRLSLATRQFPGSEVFHYYLVAGALLAVLAVIYAILGSRIGLFLRAMREDSDAASAMGVDTTRLKIAVFGLTSFLIGLTAAVYFPTIPRLTPDILNLLEMGFIVVYTVFGGLESPVAGVIAAALLVVLLEKLRVVEIGALRFEPGVWRFALFGALLVATLRFAPNGFIAPLLARLAGRRYVSAAGTLDVSRQPPAAPGPAAPRRGERSVDLQLQGLCMRFGGLVVFDDVNLSLDRPQICGLIGPNGAGKTTLVNVVTGYYAPTGGGITAGAQRVDGLGPHEMVKRGIGRTFQISRSFRRMTVLENLLVPQLALHPRMHRQMAIAKAESVLAEVGLAHLAGALAQSLSGGQQKLLELARLLMLDTAILMLDEPFAGVNPALKEAICDLVRRLRDAGRAVLLVEHDLTTVFALCDRLVVLADGRVIDDGKPEAVRRNPKVIAAYLGQTPPDAEGERAMAAAADD